jgi:hypothetical protein
MQIKEFCCFPWEKTEKVELTPEQEEHLIEVFKKL